MHTKVYTKPFARSAAVAVTAALIPLASAGTALAHVTAQPEQAPKGDHAKIAFRVPNEDPNAGTVRVKITFPLDRPLSSVKTTPMPGWSANVEKVKLEQPVKVAGTQVEEAIASITWTAAPGTRIGPDQFEEFEAYLGTLPTDTDELVMPTEQTYDSGEVVRWNAPPAEGAEEPQHPAPTLELVKGEGSHGGGSHGSGGHGNDASGQSEPEQAEAATQGGGDDTARWLGGIGLAVGALSLGLAAGALLRSRKGGSA